LECYRRSDLVFCRVTPEITAQLLATMNHEVESGGILATQLCSHMQDANLINSSRLNNLTGITTLSFLYLQRTGALSCLNPKSAHSSSCCRYAARNSALFALFVLGLWLHTVLGLILSAKF
jgi:hypothetical protein